MKRLIALAVLVAIVILGYYKLGDLLTLDYLANYEEQLRDYQQSHPVLTCVLAFLTYVLIAGLSLPGATVLTLLYGWFFGFVTAVILVSFASTTGATVAFLLSRYLFREAIQEKFGNRLQRFNQSLEKEGPFYLFALRLVPAIPFFVINAVMGLTPLNTLTYWWVSQLGMLPATIVYVYAGASVPTFEKLAEQGVGGILTPQIIVAFLALGLFPFITRFFLKSNPT